MWRMVVSSCATLRGALNVVQCREPLPADAADEETKPRQVQLIRSQNVINGVIQRRQPSGPPHGVTYLSAQFVFVHHGTPRSGTTAPGASLVISCTSFAHASHARRISSTYAKRL